MHITIMTNLIIFFLKYESCIYFECTNSMTLFCAFMNKFLSIAFILLWFISVRLPLPRHRLIVHCKLFMNRDNSNSNSFTHFCCLRLDIGKPLSTGPLLSRSWHPLQPLRGRGRGGWGSRPLAWFATRQDDGRILLSSRLNHYSSFTFFCTNNFHDTQTSLSPRVYYNVWTINSSTVHSRENAWTLVNLV